MFPYVVSMSHQYLVSPSAAKGSLWSTQMAHKCLSDCPKASQFSQCVVRGSLRVNPASNLAHGTIDVPIESLCTSLTKTIVILAF